MNYNKIRYLLFVFCFFQLTFSFVSKADSGFPNQVVLLSSVFDDNQEAKDNAYKDYADIVTRTFNEYYLNDTKVHVVIINDATQSDLFINLRDPKNLAVFWVSHGDSSNIVGSTLSGRIVNSQFVDVAPIFKNIHPNLKWLGIIGCKTRPIFEKYLDEDFYNDNQVEIVDTGSALEWLSSFFGILSNQARHHRNQTGLIIDSSNDGRLDKFAIRNSLVASRSYLKSIESSRQKKCITDSILGIKVKFHLKPQLAQLTSQFKKINNVIISTKGRPLGIATSSQNTKDQEIFVPWNPDRPISDLNFVIDSGIVALKGHEKPNLGDWEIKTTDNSIHWSVQEINHKPLGISQNVYIPNVPVNFNSKALFSYGSIFTDCESVRRIGQ